MAEVIGVVAAALQFAEVTRKAIKLAREIQSGAESGPVHRKITQLETFVEVADKIAQSWTQDDPLTEKILKQCIVTVSALTERLERVDVAETDGLRKKTKKSFIARWEKDDVEDLFRQLGRDQMALLMHRSFSLDRQVFAWERPPCHLVQKVMDGMRQLLDTRLQYSSPQDHYERSFLDAMFVTDSRDDRSALVARKGHRVEGTCGWVTETDAYRSWLSTTPGPRGLMLQGGPGKGKTMIAIYLTEQLELLADPGHSIIYFFCDNRNPKQNNALAVVRCLLWQLCRLRPAVLCHGTKELQEKGGKIENLLSVETLWRIFETMLKDAGADTVTCIIDGLDECDEDSVFIILDKLLRMKPDPRFKFLILCRPFNPRQQLPAVSASVAKLRLDPDADDEVHRDVAEFIRQRVREVANSSPERQWSEKLRLHVETTLQKQAGGTFLWVGFVTQDLKRKTSTEVRRCLKTLPADLNGIYDRILKGLPLEYRGRIRLLLHWISLAEHPMRLSELAGLINNHEKPECETEPAADSDAGSYLESEDDLLQDLLAFVGHFVLVAGRTVYFVHQSAKDYLLRSGRADDPDLEYFRIANRELAHEERGHQCLDYLHRQLSLVKEEDGWGSDEYEYTSFHYALHFWAYHVRNSGKELRYPDTITKILRLFHPDDLLRQWIQCLGEETTVTHKPGRISVLGFAISLCLDGVFNGLLEAMSVDDYISAVSAVTSVSDRPLHVAMDDYSGVPLHYFQQLLDKYGTQAVSQEKGILSRSIFGDRRVRHDKTNPEFSFSVALLAVTAEPRVFYGPDLDKALTQAVIFGDMKTIKLLVEKGADPNATDGYGNAALHLVAKIDHFSTGVKIARFLLSQNFIAVDPAPMGDKGDTPLHIAASKHGTSLVQLLLDFGATPYAINFEGRMPLHVAAMSRAHDDQRSVRKAAELYARIFPQSGSSSTSEVASLDVPNVDARDRHGQTALHLAASYSNAAVARILLDNKANVGCKDGQGRTALHMAARSGNAPIAQMLLDHEASVGCTNDQGRTALHIAAAARYLDILRMLLDYDADVDSVDAQGRTSLALVVEGISGSNVRVLSSFNDLRDRNKCIKLLIERGARRPEQDAEGRTVLHVLARGLQHRAREIRDREHMELEIQRWEVRRLAAQSQHPTTSRDSLRRNRDQSRKNQEMERGAVRVMVPFRRVRLPALEMDTQRKVQVTDDHAHGNEIRKTLARLSVDEALRDNHGLTAREYYPDDAFWEYEDKE